MHRNFARVALTRMRVASFYTCMNTNHTLVTTPLSEAVEALDVARQADSGLREEYATPPSYREPGHVARVADLHRASKFNLKVAEVSALIAIAEALTGWTPAKPSITCLHCGADVYAQGYLCCPQGAGQ